MIQGAVNRPVLTAVGFLILVLLGLFGFMNLPVSLYPDITLPTLSVTTMYVGASALDVEEEVTKELEDALGNVSNLKTIKSDSRENLSIISLEFEYGTNLDEAANDVRDALGFMTELPDGAEDPKLIKISGSMAPVAGYTVSTENPGVDIKSIVEDRVLNELSRVPGVGSAISFGGGEEKQINIDVSQVKLEQLGVSLMQVVQVLQANNLNFPLGKLEQGGIEYNLRLPAKFDNLGEIEKVVVGNNNGKLVELQDIAAVSWGVEEKVGYLRKNGEDAVMFGIFKKSGANTVDVAKRVEKKIEYFGNRYPGLNFEVIFDSSEMVEDSVHNLVNTIAIAILLVLIVSFLLLGNIRASIIIAVAIPVSLIISFIYLYLADSSLNIISLSAIAIAVGMVVDNAVVVLENVFRHREAGESRKEAAIFGAQEVSQAILASTVTTIVIFLPLMLTRGLVAVMFKELAITMPLMLTISFITAVTLAPMFSSRFLKMKKEEDFADRFFGKIESGYSGMIGWALSHRGWLLLIFLVFAGGMYLFKFVPMDFFPNPGSDQLHAKIELPIGTRVENTNEMSKNIEELIWREVPETKSITAQAGGTSEFWAGERGSHTIELYITIGETKESKFQIAEELNKKVGDIPGIKRVKFSVLGGMFGGDDEGIFGGAPIEIEIIGDDLEKADSLAEVLRDTLVNVDGISSIEVSRKKGGRELWLDPRGSEMYSYGFSAYSVGSELRTAFYGTEIGKFSEEGLEYPIIVRLDDESRNAFETIDNLQLVNMRGMPVYISNFIDPLEKRASLSVERKNKERMVVLKISVSGALGNVMREVKSVVDTYVIPKGLTINYAGQVEQQSETTGSLIFAILLGMMLVYLVMAAQFESFLDPLIIMFSVPFGFVGVALAFWVSSQSMSLMGMVGIAMLVGIVVNNAIVMIDYFNILRERGVELIEAVKTGAKRRLRPILMTTGTTVFGLLPLAFSTGSGSVLWKSLGISVVGGMVVSSFVTLLLIPNLYTIFELPYRWRRFVRCLKLLLVPFKYIYRKLRLKRRV